MIIGTYFYSQNVEKYKKDKSSTLILPKFVTFYYFNDPEELRILEIFFAVLLTKILIDNRKGVLHLYQKQKRLKK